MEHSWQVILLAVLVSCCHGKTLKFKVNQGTQNEIDRTDSNVLRQARPQDCQDIWEAGHREPGVFTIYVDESRPLQVYCEHTEESTSIIIQRRVDNSTDFNRTWSDYVRGFGFKDQDSNYWIGLEALHLLTSGASSSEYMLFVILQDWDGAASYLAHGTMQVGDKESNYRLKISNYTGTLDDDLAFNNGQSFATYDQPDEHNCAINQGAGWWYNYCTKTLLNGHYYSGGIYPPTQGWYAGMYYAGWKGYNYSLYYVSMALVRKHP